MINIAQLQDDFYDILEQITDYPIIWEYQEGNEPADNFVACYFKNWDQVGSKVTQHTGGTSPLWTTQTPHRFTLEIIGIGNKANQILLEISHRLNKDTTLFLFEEIGVSYLNQGNISSAPKLLTTGWEQRYSLEVNFNIVITEVDDLNYVEFVEITTTIKDFDDSTIIEETVIVDIVP